MNEQGSGPARAQRALGGIRPMEAPQPTETNAAAPTPPAGPSALRLTPLPPTRVPSFDLTHPYVELVYANRLGPSGVLVIRALGRILAAHRDTVEICALALALELGLRSSNDENPLGRRSPLSKALDRCAHERLVRWIEPQHLAVHTAVPAVSDRVREKLPPDARRVHDHFVKHYVIDLRDRDPA